jgi:Flp pilus assembly protein TadG
VAIALVVIIGFAALAIDIGYFYHTKNQLQGAADSAALAGAALLDGTNSLTQSNAKLEAVKFAGLNMASGSPVQLDPTNIDDVAVGSWVANTFTPNAPPINAVRVRARKTTKDAAGFPRIFGKIFDTTKQNINAEAIAGRPPRASEYISFCKDICSGPLPRDLETGPTVTMSAFAWTTLDESTSSANNLKDLLCGVSPFVDNCGKQIWSTMGGDTSVLRVLESLMYNPDYETITKGTDTSTGFTTWTIMAPYIDPCPPGAQPDPQTVVGYAVVRIKAICSPGGGAGSITGYGPSCTAAYSAPPAACSGVTNNAIVIDSVQCYPCGDPTTPPGYKSVLVK